jgi:hypothetical protein
MARTTIFAVLGLTLVSLVAIHAETQPAQKADTELRVTLLGTIAEWQYPGSKMPHGASMGDGGNPAIQDLKCQTVLTTPDSFDKVVAFYFKKLGITPTGGTAAPNGDAVSVISQEDSKARPVSLQVITINKAKTSTTLVISRGAGEKETHIAWSQYMRFGKIAPKE